MADVLELTFAEIGQILSIKEGAVPLSRETHFRLDWGTRYDNSSSSVQI